jgi:hypothetical protein
VRLEARFQAALSALPCGVQLLAAEVTAEIGRAHV